MPAGRDAVGACHASKASRSPDPRQGVLRPLLESHVNACFEEGIVRVKKDFNDLPCPALPCHKGTYQGPGARASQARLWSTRKSSVNVL